MTSTNTTQNAVPNPTPSARIPFTQIQPQEPCSAPEPLWFLLALLSRYASSTEHHLIYSHVRDFLISFEEKFHVLVLKKDCLERRTAKTPALFEVVSCIRDSLHIRSTLTVTPQGVDFCGPIPFSWEVPKEVYPNLTANGDPPVNQSSVTEMLQGARLKERQRAQNAYIQVGPSLAFDLEEGSKMDACARVAFTAPEPHKDRILQGARPLHQDQHSQRQFPPCPGRPATFFHHFHSSTHAKGPRDNVGRFDIPAPITFFGKRLQDEVELCVSFHIEYVLPYEIRFLIAFAIFRVWEMRHTVQHVESTAPMGPLLRPGQHRANGWAELGDIAFSLASHSKDLRPPRWTTLDLMGVAYHWTGFFRTCQHAAEPGRIPCWFIQVTPLFLDLSDCRIPDSLRSFQLCLPKPWNGMDQTSPVQPSPHIAAPVVAKGEVQNRATQIRSKTYDAEFEQRLKGGPLQHSFENSRRAYSRLCKLMPDAKHR